MSALKVKQIKNGFLIQCNKDEVIFLSTISAVTKFLELYFITSVQQPMSLDEMLSRVTPD